MEVHLTNSGVEVSELMAFYFRLVGVLLPGRLRALPSYSALLLAVEYNSITCAHV